MGKYVSLLRGINVSGHRKIKMQELKALFESMGFNDVSTYIQSGNVVFSSRKRNKKAILKSIEQKILTHFGFDVKVMLITADDLKSIIQNHPFVTEDKEEQKKIFVMFLEASPDPLFKSRLIEDVRNWPEKFTIENEIGYLYAVNGYGRTKLSNNFVERKLKLASTTRNWRTVNVLFDMVNNI